MTPTWSTCCKLSLTQHMLSVSLTLRWIVNLSVCIASHIPIFYSISSDHQRLHDSLLVERIVLQRWEQIGRETSLTPYLLASVVLGERKKTQRAHNKKDQTEEKKNIDGGRKGRRGGHWRIEKGGPCRTVLPKPRSIVMKMAVHMTTIAAEWQH